MKKSRVRSLVFLCALCGTNALNAAQDDGIIVRIEEPAKEESYTGISNLRGWAVSPAGMGSYDLDVYIDDVFAFSMPIGGNRTDVASVYPDYPSSEYSGFSMAFNYKNLQPGRHKILVKAYDNDGNYNEAYSYFTAERFVTTFIQNKQEVRLTTGRISVVDDQTVAIEGATLEGQRWDFNLTWDRASQSLKIAQISPAEDGSEDDSTTGDTKVIIDNPMVRADNPTSQAREISRSCNTYVESVADDGVTFENGAFLNWQRDDLWWDEGDSAFLIQYGDGLWITLHYQNQTITNIDLRKPWYIFWQEFRGTTAQNCVRREQDLEDPLLPLLPDYTIARIDSLSEEDMWVTPLIEYGDIDLGVYFYNRHQCRTWQQGDLLFIPVSEHPDNVWSTAFVNLTRLRYSSGEVFCRE